MSSTRAVVIVSTAIHTIGAAVVAGIAVLGPVLVAETALSAGDIGILIGAANVGSLPGLLATPTLVRKWGTGRALSAGCLMMAASTAAFALDLGLVAACAVLSLFGVGWGISSASGGGAVVDSAPLQRRALLTSIRQVGLPAGGVIAAALVPLLAFTSWRGLFGSLAIIMCGLAIGAAWLRVDDVSAPHKQRWWRNPPWPALTLGALILPLITAQWAFTAYLTLELTDRLDRGVATAATLFFCSQVAGATARVGFGAVSDRLGPPRGPLLAALAVACAASLAVFGMLTPTVGNLSLFACIVVVSVVALSFNGIIVVAFAEADPQGRTTVDIAAGLTVMRIANIVGPPAFGLALLYFGASASWLGLAGLVLLSAYPLWAFSRGRRPGTPAR